jgi:hypothetical protein
MDENLNDALKELLEGETHEERVHTRSQLLATLMTKQTTERGKNGKSLSGAQTLFKALQEGGIQLQDIFYLATCTFIRSSNEVMEQMMKDMGIPQDFLDKMEELETEGAATSLKDLLN